MTLEELDTPTLLLDEDIMRRNIKRLQDKLDLHSVQLRPHLKTCKSLQIAKQIKPVGPDASITVSTIAEAEYFFEGGYGDILYAVSATPHKLIRLKKLQDRGAQITLILDHIEGAKQIADAAIKLNTSFPCLIEIDCDGKRAGIKADDDALLPLATFINDQNGVSLAGVMTHSGGSYAANDIAAIKQVAIDEKIGITTAASRIREAGLPCPIVSVGSTPTATFADDFKGITEVRAGVYVFQDLVMEALNVCEKSDIAISVLSTVISHNKTHNRLLLDAGSLALSADPGKVNEMGNKHFGQICHAKTGKPIDNLYISSMNQEHGLISLDGLEYQLDDFPIGSQVRILPNHACITAAAYNEYQLLSSPSSVDGTYERCNGW
ncbi:hypothetical protein GUA87_16395 [Sneathiella sp. P13V-1]|uniref:alanine racemase n=1 Tax=Sneathiella sp. P13V-1 TaxID=2697366 RepID=UPI00187B83F0|nr:alanine racemase [Sneathiella sp. P13V-1]MBE7638438.1 hypothetical protein [Sneathiella sp. P13V-1]